MAASDTLKPDWRSPWPAPAKLNLFLHVVGRRSDGYHLLQTVFRFIDRADTLRFEPRTDERIELATPMPGVEAEHNLVVRAARALQAATGCGKGATLHLEKRLPQGGGLGGGSSDATTTLIALNHLWRCGLDAASLQRIGLALGADVPIFIHGRSAFAEGVGERFRDIVLPEAWYLVLTPPVEVPTAAIFTAPDLRRDSAPVSADTWQRVAGSNDLEAVACRLYPDVARHLAWLKTRSAARYSAMTGSGACCFAEFASENDAKAAEASLPADMKGFVARGLPHHPLLPGPETA